MTTRLDRTAETLRRLAELDAALAGEGVRVREFAESRGLSTKTIRRDLETLRSLGAEIPKGESGTTAFVFRYTDRRRRVFAKWVTEPA